MGFSYFQLPMTVYTVLFTPSVDSKHLLAFSGSLAYYYFLALLPHSACECFGVHSHSPLVRSGTAVDVVLHSSRINDSSQKGIFGPNGHSGLGILLVLNRGHDLDGIGG